MDPREAARRLGGKYSFSAAPDGGGFLYLKEFPRLQIPALRCEPEVGYVGFDERIAVN